MKNIHFLSSVWGLSSFLYVPMMKIHGIVMEKTKKQRRQYNVTQMLWKIIVMKIAQ